MALKIEIENTPTSLIDEEKDYNQLSYLMAFTEQALLVNKLTDYRTSVMNIPVTASRYYTWGFGSNHFWLSQKETNKRILLITEKTK